MVEIHRRKVRDVMQTEVVRFEPTTAIESAVQTLEDLRIGGAPVVDHRGRVLGVLSAKDIARSEHMRNGRLGEEQAELGMGGSEDENDEDGLHDEEVVLGMSDYNPALREGDTVDKWMNPEVVSVGPDASLRQVCRVMLNEGIHRVLVIENGNLLGLVSSSDIVRCVAG